MEDAPKPKKGTWLSPIYWWGPVFVWMAIIFFLSGKHSITVSPEYIWNFLFFKTLHVLEYAALFILSSRAAYKSGATGTKDESYRTAFFITILYAVTDEIHQRFVPSRQGAPRDVIIDGIGAGFIWYCLLKLLPKAPPKLKSLAKNWGVPF